MDYSVKPDYKQCVSIVTQSALKQMIKPVRNVSFRPLQTNFIYGYSRSARPSVMSFADSDSLHPRQRVMSFSATA